MGYILGQTSNNRLDTTDPKMQRIVRRAIEITEQDFMVLEGRRSQRRQYELYAQGRQVGELLKVPGWPRDIVAQPGKPKVTWTLKSNHFEGKAVDLVPYPVDWNTPSKFDAIAKAMFQAAKEQGVKLRWGADWDVDGKPREKGESDSPHFEIN